jgi:peptide/nickel transport system ATP-binding protein
VTAVASVAGLRVVAPGGATLLRGIDLDIPTGSILGVVGESGSGKSTLALALLGLLAPDLTVSGSIVLDGLELVGQPEATLRRVRGYSGAMVFQDPMTALNPVFTIGAQLVDVARRRDPGLARGEARRLAAERLGEVGFADAAARLESYPHQLSGGMRQRVVIAMALLARPRLLIADEATTALDATVQAQVAELIEAAAQKLGGSVLFISHQLGLVAELCDSVCVMYAGTLVEQGPTGPVFGRPLHPYTAALVACEVTDATEGRLRTIPGEVPSPAQALRGCPFAPRCGFVVERCRTERPAMRGLAPGQAAACHRADEWATTGVPA